MAKPTKKYLLELIAQHGPEITKAFKASIAGIKDNAQVGALITMLEKGDIAGAMSAVGMEPESFRRLDQAIVDAFESGGGKTAQTIPAAKTPDGLRMVVQFNARNDRAEAWLRDHSSTLIREIIEDQRQVIRAALADGMARGLNPRNVALDLVGRLDPETRMRRGGVIGLTSQQLDFVQRYRAELLSGDPAQLRNALARARRDAKFDGTIRKALASGKPIDPASVEKMVGRYSDRLLLLRGETIGRTEAMTALHQSQEEAYQQAIDKGALQANHVRGLWRTAADERVRHSHSMIPGMNEKGVPHGQPFSSPLGPIRFPGDPKAAAANRIGCRCWREMKVDFLAQAVEAESAVVTPAPAAKPQPTAIPAGVYNPPTAVPAAVPPANAPAPRRIPIGVYFPPTGGAKPDVRPPWPWQSAPREGAFGMKMFGDPEKFGLFNDEVGARQLARELMAGVPKSIDVDATWINYTFRGESTELSFAVRHDDVTLVRSFTRENGKLVVEHKYFELSDKFKGGGHAVRMLQTGYAAYDRLGVDIVRVHANLDLGGYVWARNGFTASDPEYMRTLLRIMGQRKLAGDRLHLLLEAIENSSDLDLMYNVSRLSDERGAFGQEFLLGSDWWGSADLTNIDQRKLLAEALKR